MTTYTNEQIEALLAKLREPASYPEEKQAAEVIEQLQAESRQRQVIMTNFHAVCSELQDCRSKLASAEERIAKLERGITD